MFVARLAAHVLGWGLAIISIDCIFAAFAMIAGLVVIITRSSDVLTIVSTTLVGFGLDFVLGF